MKTVEDHKKEVSKLSELEGGLMDLISKTNDSDLIESYDKYKHQKQICNELYLEVIRGMFPEDAKGIDSVLFDGKRLDNGDLVKGNLVQDRKGNSWIFEKSPIQKYQVPMHGKIVGCDRTFCNQVDPKTVKRGKE